MTDQIHKTEQPGYDWQATYGNCLRCGSQLQDEGDEESASEVQAGQPLVPGQSGRRGRGQDVARPPVLPDLRHGRASGAQRLRQL